MCHIQSQTIVITLCNHFITFFSIYGIQIVLSVFWPGLNVLQSHILRATFVKFSFLFQRQLIKLTPRWLLLAFCGFYETEKLLSFPFSFTVSLRLPTGLHLQNYNGVFHRPTSMQTNALLSGYWKLHPINDIIMDLCLWSKSYLLFRNLVFYAFRKRYHAVTASWKTSPTLCRYMWVIIHSKLPVPMYSRWPDSRML